MTATTRLLSVATALPPHRLSQEDTLSAARAVFGPRMRDFERLSPVFANTGIETRHAARPLSWYLEPRGWPERTAAYEEAALDLLQTVTARALAGAGMAADAVDAVVCVSTTGIATPSLDALLIQRAGFRPDIVRLPVFGLGCAGGVLGLARAGAMARAMPGATVLLLVVELCTLACRTGEATPTNVVASALFADGAAGVLLRHGGAEDGAEGRAIPVLLAHAEHTWPDTRGVMGWRMEEDGFGVIFRQDIPDLVRGRLREVAERFLHGRGLRFADLAGVICHPGGAKVLQALSEALAPAEAGFADAWEVLRSCGNMSAASVLFVLERRLAAGARGRHLATALGPGFTGAFALLDL